MENLFAELARNLFVNGKVTVAFFMGIFCLAIFLASMAINYGWSREEKIHRNQPGGFERHRSKVNFL